MTTCPMSAAARPPLFEIPTPGTFGACYLARVEKVRDQDHPSQVQVRLLGYDGVTDQDGPVWARVATPFAGSDYGAFMIPDQGDEVLVAFVNGDPRCPVVVGSLWNGSATAPETIGGERVDRWTIVGKAGTRIAIVEEQAGQATISLTTPGNVSATLTEQGGGKIELKAGGTTVTIDSQGLNVQTSAKVQMQSSQFQATAGDVTVNSAQSTFSGNVQCVTHQCTTIIAGTYTPGGGNVW